MTLKLSNRKIILLKIKDLPGSSGVYLFLNRFGNVIYIGKSINLKKRVRTYFSQSIENIHPRVKTLIMNISDIKYELTETEIEAFLLEDYLIKKHHPEYNVKGKDYKEYKYIQLTQNPYPSLIEQNSFTFHNCWGPFKDRYFTEKLIDLISEYFHIRTCSDSEPVKKCLKYDLNRCSGPCRNKISKVDYMNIVKMVTIFLNGKSNNIRKKINDKIECLLSSFHFEKIIVLKDQLKYVKKFSIRQKFLLSFSNKPLIIHDFYQGNKISFFFIKGFYSKKYKNHITEKDIKRISFENLTVKDTQSDMINNFDRGNLVFTYINKKKLDFFFM